jgi:hypothetical protein
MISLNCIDENKSFDDEKIVTLLNYKSKVDFQDLLGKVQGYSIKKNPNMAGIDVYFENNLVARCFKRDFFIFLTESGIDWKKMLSKKLLPDDAILVIIQDTFFIIEIKYKQDPRLVEEDLLLCDYNREQYIKLVAPLGLKVEYIYVLSNWFRKPEYKDVLEYINSVNCHYKFNDLPLAWLGLPLRKA